MVELIGDKANRYRTTPPRNTIKYITNKTNGDVVITSLHLKGQIKAGFTLKKGQAVHMSSIEEKKVDIIKSEEILHLYTEGYIDLIEYV